MPDWKAIDTAMTRWRKKIYHLLRDDLKIGAEKGCFDCQFYNDGDGHKGCNQSVPGGLASGRLGDWPYVGRQYGEARVGGKAARVLFVAMDRPFKGKEGDESFLDFLGEQMGWRCGAYGRNSEGTNPHMGGVDAEMECLLDDGVADEDRCQQFALVNAVFCGPKARQGKRSKRMDSNVSDTMKRNCRRQLQQVLLALEPDIVIAQGKGHPRRVCTAFGCRIVKRWACKTLPTWAVGRKPPKRNRRSEVAEGEIGGRPVSFLITTHPSNYARLGLPFWKHDAGAMPGELVGAFDFVRDRYAG